MCIRGAVAQRLLGVIIVIIRGGRCSPELVFLFRILINARRRSVYRGNN